jgi:hypothetical protein
MRVVGNPRPKFDAKKLQLASLLLMLTMFTASPLSRRGFCERITADPASAWRSMM